MDQDTCNHQMIVWGNGTHPITLQPVSKETAEDIIADHPEEYYAECDYCGLLLNT